MLVASSVSFDRSAPIGAGTRATVCRTGRSNRRRKRVTSRTGSLGSTCKRCAMSALGIFHRYDSTCATVPRPISSIDGRSWSIAIVVDAMRGAATLAGLPRPRSIKPTRSRSSSARRTVMRLTPYCFSSSFSVGSTVPGASLPRSMASMRARWTRAYRGPSLGSVILIVALKEVILPLHHNDCQHWLTDLPTEIPVSLRLAVVSITTTCM